MTKEQCPPNKGALKASARDIIPDWVIRRPKETFQGASGLADAAAAVLADPAAYYRSEIMRLFGPSAKD